MSDRFKTAHHPPRKPEVHIEVSVRLLMSGRRVGEVMGATSAQISDLQAHKMEQRRPGGMCQECSVAFERASSRFRSSSQSGVTSCGTRTCATGSKGTHQSKRWLLRPHNTTGARRKGKGE